MDQVDTMLRESCLLSGMCHPNINPVLAVCCLDELEDSQPHVIFTHSTQGNLKHFLQRCKISDVGSSQVRGTSRWYLLEGEFHRTTRRKTFKRNCSMCRGLQTSLGLSAELDWGLLIIIIRLTIITRRKIFAEPVSTWCLLKGAACIMYALATVMFFVPPNAP